MTTPKPVEGATPGQASIGLVSDTHLPRFGLRLPRALMAGLLDAAVVRVIHLGDLTRGFVIEQLEAVAPVEVVAGNNDPPEFAATFGTRRVVEIAGIRIGCTHGHLGRARTTAERAIEAFRDEAVDVIAFGHSHIPICEQHDGVWLVNPGSPTDRRRQPAFSFALIDVVQGRIQPRIVTFEDRST